MLSAWWRLVFALALTIAAGASPELAQGVSAAPSQRAPGETLVYHSSWQTAKLDWTAHYMKWSISDGILTLRPRGRSQAQLGSGWIVAPYRPSRLENIAIEAVMRVSPTSKPAWGWGGEVRLTAHFGPEDAGVSGRYLMGNDGPGAEIHDAAAPGGGRVSFSGAQPVHPGHWNTYRLEVRTDGDKRADSYSFQINGVEVAGARLGDWMQYNRIAISASTTVVVTVKSIKVYRLP